MGLSLVQRIGPVDPGKTDFRHRLLDHSRLLVRASMIGGSRTQRFDLRGLDAALMESGLFVLIPRLPGSELDGRSRPDCRWRFVGTILAQTLAILGGVLAMLRLLELTQPAGGVQEAFLERDPRPRRQIHP